ncbi:hypothetical protein GE09DRAFT_1108773 [Coniochaeta sp. 2T2.1]|nr:hypothetical protein GE09DRAFT_1108773 [Coniochaeta sp. 2T2.1]
MLLLSTLLSSIILSKWRIARLSQPSTLRPALVSRPCRIRINMGLMPDKLGFETLLVVDIDWKGNAIDSRCVRRCARRMSFFWHSINQLKHSTHGDTLNKCVCLASHLTDAEHTKILLSPIRRATRYDCLCRHATIRLMQQTNSR